MLALIAVLGLGARAYVVANPVADPADDSHAYYALSKALYEEGSFGGPDSATPATGRRGRRCSTRPASTRPAAPAKGRRGSSRRCSAWPRSSSSSCSGRRDRLGRRRRRPARRLRGRRLPALHPLDRRADERAAGDPHPARGGARLPLGERAASACAAWLLPGLLFGLTAMFRPEYLLVGAAFVVLAAIRVGSGARLAAGPRRRRRCCVAALLLPIVPWTIRNVVVLDRVVPISTGGGKALYVGTFLPADGEYQRVKALLVERYLHRDLDAALRGARTRSTRRRSSTASPTATPTCRATRPWARSASRTSPSTSAKTRSATLAMTARKVGRMWSSGVGEAMSSSARAGRPDPARRARRWPASSCSACAAAGGSWSRWRRRSSLVTAVGAASLAAPRRNEVLMTLVFPLAAAGPVAGARGPILQPRMVPRAGIFPAELTALRSAGLIVAIGARRLRGRPPPLAAQRRRADPARRRARPGARLRHRNHRRAALRLLLRKGQRRPHPRPRRLRDLHPLPADPAGALAGGAQLAPALGGARGAGLGGVPPGGAAGALPRQDRDPRPRLQRGREHRPRARPDAGRGLRRRRPRCWSSTTAPATAPATSPPSTAPRSPATSPTAAAARRCAPATG